MSVLWLECSECGEQRWSSIDSPCITTLGCKGRMKKGKQTIEQPPLFEFNILSKQDAQLQLF